MAYNIKQRLSSEQFSRYQQGKQTLLSLSSYTLNDRPSSKGIDAETIRKKMYEPIIQLYDWLFNIGESVTAISENTMKIFLLDISAGLVFNFVGNIATFNTVFTTEQMNVLANYVATTTVKEFNLILNARFVVVHAIIQEEFDMYKIYGFCIDLETDNFANAAIYVNRATYEANGKIALNVTVDYVESQIVIAKNEIKSYLEKNYVPKKDIKLIDTISLSNGEVLTPLTTNGFIELKTYN